MPISQGGAHASSIQVRNLELLHKLQFAKLVEAWNKYHIAKRDQATNPNSPYKNYLLSAHVQKLIPLTAKWLTRQMKFEKIPGSNAKFSQFPITTTDWLNPTKFNYLIQLRDQLDAQKHQTTAGVNCPPGYYQDYFGLCQKAKRSQMAGTVGFIPLLIWAIVIIVAAVYADDMVDEMNTTTEEQAELTTVTNNFCADNNLTPAQCTELLKQQTDATGGGDSIPWFKIAVGGVLLYAGYKWIAPKAKGYSDKIKSYHAKYKELSA